MIATLNLALRFGLELAGLAALAVAGFQGFEGPLRWLTAIGAPAVVVIFWALVVAPTATNGIAVWVREVIGSLVLLCAAGALALVGHATLALVFAVLIVGNNVLIVVLRDRVPWQGVGD